MAGTKPKVVTWDNANDKKLLLEAFYSAHSQGLKLDFIMIATMFGCTPRSIEERFKILRKLAQAARDPSYPLAPGRSSKVEAELRANLDREVPNNDGSSKRTVVRKPISAAAKKKAAIEAYEAMDDEEVSDARDEDTDVVVGEHAATEEDHTIGEAIVEAATMESDGETVYEDAKAELLEEYEEDIGDGHASTSTVTAGKKSAAPVRAEDDEDVDDEYTIGNAVGMANVRFVDSDSDNSEYGFESAAASDFEKLQEGAPGSSSCGESSCFKRKRDVEEGPTLHQPVLLHQLFRNDIPTWVDGMLELHES